MFVPAGGLPAQKMLSLRRLKAMGETAGSFSGPKRATEALVAYRQRNNATAGGQRRVCRLWTRLFDGCRCLAFAADSDTKA
jgi:hypothetical protein